MPTTNRVAARRFELMAAEYLQRLGARIRERRDEKGLTQAGLARLLPGTTDGAQVSRWERGLHRPSDDTLEHIADVLDVTMDYFLAAPAQKDDGTPDLFAAKDDHDGLAGQLAEINRKLDRNFVLLEKVLAKLGVKDWEEAEGLRVPGFPAGIAELLRPRADTHPRSEAEEA